MTTCLEAAANSPSSRWTHTHTHARAENRHWPQALIQEWKCNAMQDKANL